MATPLQMPVDAEATTVGSVLGTLAFMSPEQARGETDALGPATDIYSLGAILYNILTGKTPLAAAGGSGQTKSEMLAHVRRGDFPRPKSINQNIASALQAISEKAMSHAPADRYKRGGPAGRRRRPLDGRRTRFRPGMNLGKLVFVARPNAIKLA